MWQARWKICVQHSLSCLIWLMFHNPTIRVNLRGRLVLNPSVWESRGMSILWVRGFGARANRQIIFP
jgi:hypothetical protein